MADIVLPRRTTEFGPRTQTARVPSAADVQDVRVASDPGLRVPAGAFGGGLAVGGEELRAGVRNLAEGAFAAAKKQQQLYDFTHKNEAIQTYKRSVMEEFQRRQVEDDPARPGFMDDFGKYLNDKTSETISALPENISETARADLRADMGAQNTSFLGIAGDLSVKTLSSRANATFTSGVNELSAQARTYPAAVDDLISQGDKTLAELSLNLTPEQEETQRVDLRRNLIQASINGALDANDFSTARNILGKQDYAAFLDARDRDILTNKIDAAEDLLRRKSASEIAGMADDHFASVATTGQGIPGFMAKASAALTPEQFAEFQRKENVSRETFNFTDTAKFASPEDIRAKVDAFRPEPGTVGYADRLRAYEAVQRSANDILKQRAADPAGYAMKMPDVAQAWAEATDPNGQKTLNDYAVKTIAAQDAMGIPISQQRVMPEATAKTLATDLSIPDRAEQSADQILSLSRGYGKSWNMAYRDLVAAGLSPEMSVLATLDTDADIIARKDLASALKAGKKGLSDIVPDADRKTIVSGVESALMPWAKAELGRGATDRNVQAMKSAAETLAMHYASRGQEASQASESAINALLGRYEILDTPSFNMYVPTGKADDVEATGRRIMDSLRPNMLPDPGGQEFLTPEQRKEAYLRAVKNGTWVLDETGTSAVLLDEIGQPVFANDANGNMNLVKFDIGASMAAQSELTYQEPQAVP